MRFLRMKPGHGDELLAEGDIELREDEERLIEEFRRQLSLGMWAAVPTQHADGRREAQMVKAFDEVSRDADRVIFFPHALQAARSSDVTTMVLALSATAIVIVALLWEVATPRVRGSLEARRANRALVPGAAGLEGYDPGRERRAEQRARQLLCSCVNEEEWAMYRELGFIRVWGRLAGGPVRGGTDRTRDGAPYAYLVYPHKPVVAYLPQTRELLSEYCVEFPDETRPFGSARLPDSDDVLAKWMALTGDERRLIGEANMHLPGRQVDPKAVRRDLWRLRAWERDRLRKAERAHSR